MRATRLLAALSFAVAAGCNALVGIDEPIEQGPGGSASADASTGGTGATAGSGGTAGTGGVAGSGTGGVAGSGTGGVAGSGTGGVAGSGTGGVAGSGTGGVAGSGTGGACVEITWYADTDNDDYGDPDNAVSACTVPSGYVADNTDCNDKVETTHPNAPELCNAVDDNCNGSKDDGFGCIMGAAVSCTTTCGTQGTGICTASCTIPNGSSCTAPAEVCNGTDDDCDGLGDYNLVKASLRRTNATSTIELASPIVVANADSTNTVIYRRNIGGNVFDVYAQKVDASGANSGSAVRLVSGTSYGNYVTGVDAIVLQGTLYVAWISSTGVAYLAGYNPSTYANTKTTKSYAGTYGGTGLQTKHLLLTAPAGQVLHLTLLETSSSGAAIERVEITPPSGATLPAGTRKLPIQGGIAQTAFGAAAGDNTILAYLDTDARVSLIRDNGYTANADFRDLASITGKIRYPSVAVTADNAIGVLWAEYPSSGTSSVKFAYLSSFYATPVVKTVGTNPPYYLSGSTEFYRRPTALAYVSGPAYFLAGFSSATSNQFLTDYPKLFAVWPVGATFPQQAVTLGDFSSVLNNDDVALAAKSNGAIFGYDISGGDAVASQMIGCY